MKYYRISQETVDEIKRRLKIRNQMIKFYQKTLREQRESESLEEIGIGGFEPTEEVDNRDKSSMIPDMMVTGEYHYPNSDKICSIYSIYEQAMAKQTKEIARSVNDLKNQDEKDRVIKDLQSQLYNQHQTIETLQKALEVKINECPVTISAGDGPDITDFVELKDYKHMDHDDLVKAVRHMATKIKQLQADNTLKAEMINRQGSSHSIIEFWKDKYEMAQAELSKFSDNNHIEHDAKVKELQDRLYDLESLNMKLTKEKDEISQQLDKTRVYYEQKIEELKAALEAEKAKTSSMMVLSEKVQSTAENYDSASKATIEDLQARIGRQSDTIESLTNKNRKLAATLDKVSSDLDTLNTTIDRLNEMIGPHSDIDDLKDKIFVIEAFTKDNSIRYYISIDKKELPASAKLAKEMSKYFNTIKKEDNK